MWEPRPLTPLWAFKACYRESFTFTLSNTPFLLGCPPGHWQGWGKDRHLPPPPPTWNLEKVTIEKKTKHAVPVINTKNSVLNKLGHSVKIIINSLNVNWIWGCHSSDYEKLYPKRQKFSV
jgi:hypothetical protein